MGLYNYVKRLQAKRYKFNARFDKKSLLHGYSIGIGNSGYKASDLGKDRNLLVSKIEQTWQKLHPNAGSTLKQDENKVGTKVTANVQTSITQIATNDVAPDYTEWHENTITIRTDT